MIPGIRLPVVRYVPHRTKNPIIADQIATNHKKADISPRQRAMLEFAIKVSKDSPSIEDADFELLQSHGFSTLFRGRAPGLHDASRTVGAGARFDRLRARAVGG